MNSSSDRAGSGVLTEQSTKVSERPSAFTVGTPAFIHDCGSCKFLGRMNSDYSGEGRVYDLYYHSADAGCCESVVARFGSYGSAYYSGMRFTEPYIDISNVERPGIPMLVEALKRAIALGFKESA